MLHAPRNDNELARIHNLFMVAKLHPHPACYYQKHFVFIVVVMPDKLSLEANRLHVALVDFAEDLRAPRLADLRKFLRDVDGFHSVLRAQTRISESAPPRR